MINISMAKRDISVLERETDHAKQVASGQIKSVRSLSPCVKMRCKETLCAFHKR